MEIPLRNKAGEVVASAIVDDDDHDRIVAKGRWYRDSRGYAVHAFRDNGETTSIKMHRFILGYQRGDPEVDHRDRNKLNNRKTNLRSATRGQNAQNHPGFGGSSIHRGVHWNTKRKRWIVIHTLDGKKIYLGQFMTEEAAAEAAREWRKIWMPYSIE